MTTLAMAIIDGTGPYSNSKYEASMSQSFCSKLALGLGPNAAYMRGPSGEGYRINERAAWAADKLTTFRRSNSATRLMLAGYSRGGSAAVIAATMLSEQGVEIDAMFLFDPVARHLSADSSVIPGNVKAAWIARRIIGAKEMDKYDYSLLGDLAGHNPVRNWFGTTATKAAPNVQVTADSFLGSHGALGGVGWTHVNEDAQCQVNVAKFVNTGLQASAVPIQLQPDPPNSKP